MDSVLDSFVDKKKASSLYISLEDGESVSVLLREMKIVTKAGYGGEEKECLRLICDVETNEGLKIKQFDNSTQRFAEALREHKITVGAKFTITRHGTQTKTRYEISNVVATV